jgi:hypothetical protein
MLKIKQNKEGVSPLIATIILVALSVMLGAMVINFAQTSAIDLTKNTNQVIDSGLKCTLDVPIKLLEANRQELICFNRSGSYNLEFVLENQGSVDSSGVRVIILDFNDNIKTTDILSELRSHASMKYNLSVATADDGSPVVYPLIKVLITPLLSTENGYAICSESRIDLENIEAC